MEKCFCGAESVGRLALETDEMPERVCLACLLQGANRALADKVPFWARTHYRLELGTPNAPWALRQQAAELDALEEEERAPRDSGDDDDRAYEEWKDKQLAAGVYP